MSVSRARIARDVRGDSSLVAVSGHRLAPAQPLAGQAARRLGDVPAPEWDALVPPGNSPLKHGYLSAWERVELAGLCSRPVLAYEPQTTTPVAACPGYFYDLDVPSVRSPRAGAVAQALRRVWPRLLFVRTYELGSPTPFTNPFLVAAGRPRAEAIEVLMQAAMSEARDGGAQFVLVQNFASSSVPAAGVLPELGFARIPIPPTAVVGLGYDSFDSYLAAMRAQYRRRAKQTFRLSRGLTVEHVRDFGHLAHELARLWRAVFQRATEVKREILTPEFFRAVSNLEDTSALMTRREDGSVASFALLLHEHPWLSFLHCGFEADAGRREGAYFRLLYEIVRVAINGGYEQVDMGMTTLEPKLDVGAVPIPLFAWVKHRNALVQRIILALGRGPMRSPDLQPRNVFKAGASSAEEIVTRRLPA